MDEKKKLTEDELAQVSGGSSGGVVMTDCYYCSQKHPMRCETGVNIITNGLKKFDGASRYYCSVVQKSFYVVQFPNGGTAILDNDQKIVR